MNTSVMRSSSRSKRITWGGGLGIGIGLIGLPLVLVALWPTASHSPYDVNTMVLAAGVGLCSISYALGRIAISALTEESRRPISPPGRRPYLVAGISFVVAVLCLLIALS